MRWTSACTLARENTERGLSWTSGASVVSLISLLPSKTT
jgi:hypothetical protein